MTKDDWCRRTTWTPEDERAFFDRNRRSRGADSKAQYIRIQAETLRQTGKPPLIEAALKLLELGFLDYPNTFDCALSYECAAKCSESLNRINDAIAYYRRALNRENELPGIRTNACFHFAKLVAAIAHRDLYDEAIVALDNFGHPVFPWHTYMIQGPKAIIARNRGDNVSAKSFAEMALEASTICDSGLGRGRGAIGIVNNIENVFHQQLEKIAGA